MLWAAALTCFFCFLRAGEVCVPGDHGFDAGAHLTPSDISVDNKMNPKVMQVRITASKTDPCRLGCNMFMGRTGKSSDAGVPNHSQGASGTSVPPVCLCQWKTTYQGSVCGRDAGGASCIRHRPSAVLGAQLPYRGSYDSC